MTWRDAKQAPAGLELVRRFVNTRDLARGGDQLAVPGGAVEWFATAGLIDPGTGDADLAAWPVSEPAFEIPSAGVRRAIELRESLREILLAHNGGGSDTRRAQAVVNEALRRGQVVPSLGADGELHLNSYATRLNRTLGQIAAIVAEAAAAGSWTRLKACPSCNWAFYDTTRNSAGRWCDMKVCGNRAKQQAFQARRAD